MWLPRPGAPEKSGTRPRSWVDRIALQVMVEKTVKPGSGEMAAVWRAVPERRPVSGGGVDPALLQPAAVEALGDELGIAGPVGPPRDVAERRLGPLGHEQARVQPLREAAEVDRLPVALGLLEAEHIDHPGHG